MRATGDAIVRPADGEVLEGRNASQAFDPRIMADGTGVDLTTTEADLLASGLEPFARGGRTSTDAGGAVVLRGEVVPRAR